jgi:hypothetical protein
MTPSNLKYVYSYNGNRREEIVDFDNGLKIEKKLCILTEEVTSWKSFTVTLQTILDPTKRYTHTWNLTDTGTGLSGWNPERMRTNPVVRP